MGYTVVYYIQGVEGNIVDMFQATTVFLLQAQCVLLSSSSRSVASDLRCMLRFAVRPSYARTRNMLQLACRTFHLLPLFGASIANGLCFRVLYTPTAQIHIATRYTGRVDGRGVGFPLQVCSRP